MKFFLTLAIIVLGLQFANTQNPHTTYLENELIKAHNELPKIIKAIDRRGSVLLPPLLRNAHYLIEKTRLRIVGRPLTSEILKEVSKDLLRTIQKLEQFKEEHRNGRPKSANLVDLQTNKQFVDRIQRLQQEVVEMEVLYYKFENYENRLEDLRKEIYSCYNNPLCSIDRDLKILLDVFYQEVNRFESFRQQNQLPLSKSIPREIEMVDLIANMPSVEYQPVLKQIKEYRDAAIRTGKEIEEGLAQKFGESPFSIQVSMACKDSLCRSGVFKLQVTAKQGPLGPIAITQTWDSGRYKSDASEEAAQRFVTLLIKQVLRNKGIGNRGFSVEVLGTADQVPIKRYLKYGLECGPLEGQTKLQIRGNKITNNRQLAYVRAFCLKEAALSVLGLEPRKLEVKTAVHNSEGAQSRSGQLIFHIDELNAKEVDRLSDAAKKHLAGEIRAIGLYAKVINLRSKETNLIHSK